MTNRGEYLFRGLIKKNRNEEFSVLFNFNGTDNLCFNWRSQKNPMRLTEKAVQAILPEIRNIKLKFLHFPLQKL